MPSDEFQQLVYLIQRQLRTRPDTAVSESKRIRDRNTGKRREVDVVVEFKESGAQFILAYECQRRGRKPGIEWVEQMIKKHEHLSDKLVLVTRRPLTADAADQARRHGVETIELNAAMTTDWTAFIDQYKDLFFASFDFAVQEYTIECEHPAGTPPMNNTEEVIVTQGANTATLPVAIHKLLHDRVQFGKPAMDLWYKLPLDERKDEHTMTLTASPPSENPWVLTQAGRSYRLTKLSIKVAVKIGTSPLVLGVSQYSDTRVAHGTATPDKGSMAGQTVRLVMTERQGEPPKAELAILEGKKPQPRTVEVSLEVKPDSA